MKKTKKEADGVTRRAMKYKVSGMSSHSKHQIDKTLGCCRLVWNKMVADNNEQYNQYKIDKLLGIKPIPNTFNKVTYYKGLKDCDFLKEVDSLALANVNLNFKKAYFKARAGTAGFPKFHKKHGGQSFTTNNQHLVRNTKSKGTVEINTIKLLRGSKLKKDSRLLKQAGDLPIRNRGVYLCLPKGIIVELNYYRKLPKGTIKNVTVSKKNYNYYVSILLEDLEDCSLPKLKTAIGIDLGLKNTVITSNGKRYKNPKAYYRYESKVQNMQRALDHKKKISKKEHNGVVEWSKKMEKLQLHINKTHERIANIRKAHHYNIINELIAENQTIYSENLNISGMLKNKKLAKSIQDVAWGNLTIILSNQCKKYGREYIKIGRYVASTQLCNHCGEQNTKIKGYKGLGIRKWTCQKCGVKHDRDINAGINILNKGKEMTEQNVVQ